MKICQKTIIILHGWQSSKEKWQAVKKNLESSVILSTSEDFVFSQHRLREESRIKVLVPDLPGFKKETELSRVWYLDDYVEWFKKFSRALNALSAREESRFFLLGHSFGGRIAIKFAQKYPEKLKGLILVSAAGIIPKQNIVYLTFLAGAKKFKFFLLKIPLLKFFFPFFREIFYKYILRRTDYIKAEKFPYLKETFKNVIKEDLREHFNKIKVPCLIIWGEKDKLTPLSDGYLMNQEIQGSKIEVLQNIGHSPHRETPEILAQKITNFIKEKI